MFLKELNDSIMIINLLQPSG